MPSQSVSRRRILTTSVAMAGSAIIPRARSAEPVELKVSHYLPPNHTFQKVLVQWADTLDHKSSGGLKLRIYPASQLGPVNRQFDLARTGIADMAIGLHGATPGRYPLTDLVSLPFQSPKAGSNSAVTSRRLTDLAPTYLAKEHQGLRILWMATTNPLKLHFTKARPRTLADFAGLRIRYAGVQFADIIRTLGAVPLDVPPGETTDALAKGVIDGAMFPYEATQSFALGDVVHTSIEPGTATATFAFVANPRKFDSLPREFQDLITATTGPEEASHVGATFDQAEAAGRQYMLDKGVQILTLTPAELDTLRTRLAPVSEAAIDVQEKAGRPARAFLAAYTA
jgi:TRAP-type C4-dicarboxylate transport system substrate-binding protein